MAQHVYDSNWAMFAIVMMSVWMTFGTNMMIFLAGLQGIPANLYEASKIEGASRWKTFRYVLGHPFHGPLSS